MPSYTITVVRGGGQLHPVIIRDPGLFAVCEQALAKAQDLAVNGCPFGDSIPPRQVEVRNGEGVLVLCVAIDESLKPRRDLGDNTPVV
jgi:hypothetical protein